MLFQFGGGSHVCLGRYISLVEMSKVLPMLFRDFEMELTDPDAPLVEEAFFFVVKSGMMTRIKKRLHGNGHVQA